VAARGGDLWRYRGLYPEGTLGAALTATPTRFALVAGAAGLAATSVMFPLSPAKAAGLFVSAGIAGRLAVPRRGRVVDVGLAILATTSAYLADGALGMVMLRWAAAMIAIGMSPMIARSIWRLCAAQAWPVPIPTRAVRRGYAEPPNASQSRRVALLTAQRRARNSHIR
jgi:hypothetical protein